MRLLESLTIMEEEFVLGIPHNRKGNLCYDDCSNYLAYSNESQVAGFGIQASVVESSFADKQLAGLRVLRKVCGVYSKQIHRLVRTRQNCIL